MSASVSDTQGVLRDLIKPHPVAEEFTHVRALLTDDLIGRNYEELPAASPRMIEEQSSIFSNVNDQSSLFGIMKSETEPQNIYGDGKMTQPAETQTKLQESFVRDDVDELPKIKYRERRVIGLSSKKVDPEIDKGKSHCHQHHHYKKHYNKNCSLHNFDIKKLKSIVDAHPRQDNNKENGTKMVKSNSKRSLHDQWKELVPPLFSVIADDQNDQKEESYGERQRKLYSKFSDTINVKKKQNSYTTYKTKMKQIKKDKALKEQQSKGSKIAKSHKQQLKSSILKYQQKKAKCYEENAKSNGNHCDNSSQGKGKIEPELSSQGNNTSFPNTKSENESIFGDRMNVECVQNDINLLPDLHISSDDELDQINANIVKKREKHKKRHLSVDQSLLPVVLITPLKIHRSLSGIENSKRQQHDGIFDIMEKTITEQQSLLKHEKEGKTSPVFAETLKAQYKEITPINSFKPKAEFEIDRNSSEKSKQDSKMLSFSGDDLINRQSDSESLPDISDSERQHHSGSSNIMEKKITEKPSLLKHEKEGKTSPVDAETLKAQYKKVTPINSFELKAEFEIDRNTCSSEKSKQDSKMLSFSGDDLKNSQSDSESLPDISFEDTVEQVLDDDWYTEKAKLQAQMFRESMKHGFGKTSTFFEDEVKIDRHFLDILTKNEEKEKPALIDVGYEQNIECNQEESSEYESPLPKIVYKINVDSCRIREQTKSKLEPKSDRMSLLPGNENSHVLKNKTFSTNEENLMDLVMNATDIPVININHIDLTNTHLYASSVPLRQIHSSASTRHLYLSELPLIKIDINGTCVSSHRTEDIGENHLDKNLPYISPIKNQPPITSYFDPLNQKSDLKNLKINSNNNAEPKDVNTELIYPNTKERMQGIRVKASENEEVLNYERKDFSESVSKIKQYNPPSKVSHSGPDAEKYDITGSKITIIRDCSVKLQKLKAPFIEIEPDSNESENEIDQSKDEITGVYHKGERKRKVSCRLLSQSSLLSQITSADSFTPDFYGRLNKQLETFMQEARFGCDIEHIPNKLPLFQKNVCEIFLEEGSKNFQDSLDILNSLLHYKPQSHIIAQVINIAFFSQVPKTFVFKAFHLLQELNVRFPGEVKVEWEVLERCLEIIVNENSDEITQLSVLQATLLLKLLTIVLKLDLCSKNFKDLREIKTSTAYKLFSFDVHAGYPSKLIKYMGSLFNGNQLVETVIDMREENVFVNVNVVEIIQDLLDISVEVSSSCVCQAGHLAEDLKNLYVNQPVIERKKLLVNSVKSSLIRYRLIELILESQYRETRPIPTPFPDSVLQIMECFFKAIPLTPTGTLEFTAEQCEELAMLMYYVVNSYVECCRKKTNESLRARAANCFPQDLVTTTIDETNLLHEYIDDFLDHLFGLNSHVTPATEHYIMMIQCLSDLD